jgi:hypothetical protein
LQLIEATLPVHDIHNRMSADHDIAIEELNPVELVALASKIFLVTEGETSDEKLERILLIEPFSTNPSYQQYLRTNWAEVVSHA